MVTKYKIPCSYCGTIVERYVFCSGACKVHGHRERKEKLFKSVTINGEKIEINKVGASVKIVEGVPVVDEESGISDHKRPGYHFSAVLNGYVKD